VVEVDTVIWVVSEPRHQHLTNGKGCMLSRMVRHIHGEAKPVCGVGEDMYLLYILQTNIVCLTNSVRDCSQFSVVRCGETSCRPVVIEVPSCQRWKAATDWRGRDGLDASVTMQMR
jgi:hypothetical protein